MNVYRATDLRLLADAFCQGTGIAAAALGQKMGLNDKIFPRLLRGEGCTLSSAEIASDWFNDNWPDALAWPLSQTSVPWTAKDKHSGKDAHQ